MKMGSFVRSSFSQFGNKKSLRSILQFPILNSYSQYSNYDSTINMSSMTNDNEKTSSSRKLPNKKIIQAGCIGFLFGSLSTLYLFKKKNNPNTTSQIDNTKTERPKLSISHVLSHCTPAIVCIRFHKDSAVVSEQSGFITHPTGLILTVTDEPNTYDKVSIKTQDGRIFYAALIENDELSGLSIYKIITNRDIKFHFLEFMSPPEGPPKIGDILISLGVKDSNTFENFSMGILKNQKPNEFGQREIYLSKMAFQDNFTHGGPIVNIYGKVIGVNKTKINSESNLQTSIPTFNLDKLRLKYLKL